MLKDTEIKSKDIKRFSMPSVYAKMQIIHKLQYYYFFCHLSHFRTADFLHVHIIVTFFGCLASEGPSFLFLGRTHYIASQIPFLFPTC